MVAHNRSGYAIAIIWFLSADKSPAPQKVRSAQNYSCHLAFRTICAIVWLHHYPEPNIDLENQTTNRIVLLGTATTFRSKERRTLWPT